MTGAARAGRPDGGFALPTVIVFLIALALIGGAAATFTSRDLKVVGLQTAALRASISAAAGLEHAAAVFAREGPDGTDAWPVRGEIGGFGYEVTARRDTADLGAGPGPVSHDEAATGNPFNTEERGEPVYVLVSVARRPPSFRAVERLWIARRDGLRVPAAFTVNARGSVEWTDAWTVSGVNSLVDGTARDSTDAATEGACQENRPAVHLSRAGAGPVSAPEDGLSGNLAHRATEPPYTTAGSEPRWTGAEDVLGVAEGTLDPYARTGLEHGILPPDSLSGVVWITDRAGSLGRCLTRQGCANIQGRGILIVHNPLYNPREHDPDDPLFDPLKAASPLHAPASLDDLDGGTFRGLVLVDRLPSEPSGSFTIYGGLVVLSSTGAGVRFGGAGGGLVKYSCDALTEAARAVDLGPRRLAWRGM